MYANIYLFSLSTQVDSVTAAVQEQPSTVHRHKEILANTISMLYIFPLTTTLTCTALYVCMLVVAGLCPIPDYIHHYVIKSVYF